jgi:hypothetical protein
VSGSRAGDAAQGQDSGGVAGMVAEGGGEVDRPRPALCHPRDQPRMNRTLRENAGALPTPQGDPSEEGSGG